MTQVIQSVGVTDSSGNPVTGKSVLHCTTLNLHKKLILIICRCQW